MKLASIFVAAAMAIGAVIPVAAAPVVPPDIAQNSTGWIAQQAPGFYRIRVGDLRMTALSDGTALRDLTKIMSNPTEARQAFDASHQTLPTELSINGFLIDTGTQRILVDTGSGGSSGPNSGRLVENMRAAGYQPEDIDVILLTHLHGDHAGGLSVGGERVFGNAIVYVDKHDSQYWLSAGNAQAAPADRRAAFEQAHRNVDPYVNAGRLRTFDGATQLMPGIRSVPEYGHTPGLTGFMIESRGERLLLWGDIVHAAEVQFRDPAVTVDFDVNPKEAIAARERIFSDAARRGYLVGGAHLSFPGLGHVRAEQIGYSWVPIPYGVILQDEQAAQP
jgi:glyoxylase-like metal-dependent hydrolase (beta-lactamase superfamily II)